MYPPFLAPPMEQRVLLPQLVQYLPDHEVDHLGDGRRFTVESGRCGQDDRPGAGQFQLVLYHYRAQGRLPGHYYELPPLLQCDRRGPGDQRIGDPGGDLPHGGFGTGTDDHPVVLVAAGRDGREQVFVIVYHGRYALYVDDLGAGLLDQHPFAHLRHNQGLLSLDAFK